MTIVLSKVQKFFNNLVSKIKDRITKTLEKLKNPDHPFWLFTTLFVLAIILFSIVLVKNLFTIPLSGDFVLQQYPFYTNGYDDWWKFIKTGEFPYWDYSTFLGANNIGSNAFYYLLNPFFLPILLFPRDLIPQGIAILMMTKMALAGMTFYALLRYHKISIKTARMVAIAYAFCGWNMYYLWFNHFLEICVMFPVILLGIDKAVKEKKPWLLIMSIFIMGLCNYFFLVSSCICGVFYAGYRYFQTIRKRNAKENMIVFAVGFFGFLIGVMMACLVFLPVINIVLSTPRVEESSYLDSLLNALKALKTTFNKQNLDVLWKLLTEWQSDKKAWYPVATFFFPSVSGFNNVLFPNSGYDNTLSSVFIYTPMMLFLVPSVINCIRNKKWSGVIATILLIVAVTTPFFYYLCYGFTIDYGRWEIFVTTSALLLIAKNYEERDKMKGWYFDLSFVICIVLAVMVTKVAFDMQQALSTNGLREIGDRIYVVYGQLAYIVAVYIFLRTQFRKDKLTSWLSSLLMIEAVVMGNLTFTYQSPTKYSELSGGLDNIREEEKIVRALQKQDQSFYRIFNTSADRGSNNLAMREGYKGVGTFHSLYNFNTQDFLHWSQVNYSRNNWSMGVHEKRYNLDTFLNIKYYLTKNSDRNIPLGFTNISSSLGVEMKNHYVFENENYIELGYAFDNIIPYYMVNLMEDEFGNPLLNENGNRQYVSYSEDYQNLLNDAHSRIPINVDQNEVAYLSGGIIHNDYLEELIDEAPELTIREGLFSAPSILRQQQNVAVQIPADEEKILSDNGQTIPDPIFIAANRSIPPADYKDKSRITITPADGDPICPTATVDNGCYLSVRVRMGENAYIRLYNMNSEEINGDKHMFHGYGIGSDYKYARGFYTKEPLSKIEVTIFSDQEFSLVYPQVYTEQYSEYLKRINALKPYSFEDIHYTDNTISFTTDYDQKRFIVLSVPYEKGWTVKRIYDSGQKENARIYLAQGGFLGFVSGVGDVRYELEFYPPQLNEGLALFAAGSFIFASTWGATYFIERCRKKKLEQINKEK